MTAFAKRLLRVLPALLWLGCRDAPDEVEPSEAASAAGQGKGSGMSASDREKSLAAAQEAEESRRERVAGALNPKGLEPYSGPVGAIAGTVTIGAESPPNVAGMLEKLPQAGCEGARKMQGKLFRRGPRGTLADALVTVTQYEGFVPSREEAVRVEMRDCAFDSRTVALTFGQRLDVFNLDERPYIPRIAGAPTPVLRVAMPKGGPVPLFVPKPGKYALVEETHDYMLADVLVLQYPTFDVTGLDGHYEIRGIPVGSVKVNAYSPATGKVAAATVEIEPGQTKTVDLAIEFSPEDYQRARSGAAQAPRPQSDSPAGSSP